MLLYKDELLEYFGQNIPVKDFYSNGDGILVGPYPEYNEYILKHHPDMEYRDGKVYIKPAFNTRENPNNDY